MEKNTKSRAVNGAGSWGTKTINGIQYQVYKKYINGKRKEFYGKTKTEAQKKCNAYEASILGCDDKDFKKMALEDYMATWLYGTFRGEVADRTFDDKENIMTSHITGTPIGYMQMGAIDTNQIQDMLYDKAEIYSYDTCRKIYTILNQMFKHATTKEGRYKQNPMDSVTKVSQKRVKQKPKEEPFLEESDIQKLINEAERVNTASCKINGEIGTKVYGMNAQLILMLLYTGARTEEGLPLRYKDFVEKSEDEILVHFQHVVVDVVVRDKDGKPKRNEKGQLVKTQIDIPEMKTDKSNRFVPLNKEARALYKQIKAEHPHHKPDDYIFLTEKGTLPDPRNVRRTLTSMLTRAECDVQEMGLHGLRRSFATRLINNDTSLIVISELLGHSNIVTTQNQYAKILMKKKAEAIELMDFKQQEEPVSSESVTTPKSSEPPKTATNTPTNCVSFAAFKNSKQKKVK